VLGRGLVWEGLAYRAQWRHAGVWDSPYPFFSWDTQDILESQKKKDIAVSARLGSAYGSSIRSGGTPRTLLARLLVGLATGNPFW